MKSDKIDLEVLVIGTFFVRILVRQLGKRWNLSLMQLKNSEKDGLNGTNVKKMSKMCQQCVKKMSKV